MKKILFIHPFFPYPLASGGHQALFNGILAVKDDYDIYLAYEAWEGEEYNKAEKDFLERIPNAHLFPLLHKKVKLSYRQRLINKLKRILKGVFTSPILTDERIAMCSSWLNTVSPMNADWLEHIDNICTKYQFDMIQVEMPWMVSQVLSLPDHAKKVYVHHELGFVKRELEVNGINSSAYVETCKKFADMNEIALLNMYDMIVTLSSVDAKKLKEKGVNVAVKPSFAVVDIPDQIDFTACDGNRLTFLGPDLNPPNVIGISWFLDNCWPKLKSINPSCTLDIIGIWDKKRTIEFSEKYKDVHFLGFVENLHDAISGSIMIVPITIGSGIRMKILEASLMGVPYVTTSVGVEGIPVVNDQHCFIADDEVGFVNAIIKLRNVELQKNLVSNSWQLIRNKYTIDALRKNRMKIYQCVLES